MNSKFFTPTSVTPGSQQTPVTPGFTHSLADNESTLSPYGPKWCRHSSNYMHGNFTTSDLENDEKYDKKYKSHFKKKIL